MVNFASPSKHRCYNFQIVAATSLFSTCFTVFFNGETDSFTCCYSIFLIFEQLYMQTARDSAIKRATDLQKQFSDLYEDHEKLRKVKVSELHGRVSFIGEQFITCGSDVNVLLHMSFADGFN